MSLSELSGLGTGKLLLPKGTQIVEGSFQVQIGTDYANSTGEFSDKITAAELNDTYGIVVTAKTNTIISSTHMIEYTDFDIQIGENGDSELVFEKVVFA